MSETVTFSVVVPAHNEALNLPSLHARLSSVFEEIGLPAELIVVDDGSTDDSAEVAASLDGGLVPVRVVSLSRNFGHQTALTAGIDLSAGDAVILMDADLQHPPETIHEMVALWRQGADVVYGVRSREDAEGFFKRSTAGLFYRLLDKITSIDVPIDAADFRLLDRRVVEALGHMREDDRYLRGMVAWLGFRQTQVEFTRPERFAGESKYTLRRMFSFALSGIAGFSHRPLHLATALGFLFSGLAFAAGIFAISQKLLGGDLVPGWASILVVITFIGGIQLLVLGVIGAYLGRVYSEVKRRPLYVVSELRGFPDDRRGAPRAVSPEPARRQADERRSGSAPAAIAIDD
ncbi:MAG: glycosyltransferase family 2 protein [Actinobacteria bacterium]|nr:glycosyltransferase family 2 protein [Actinomycetota bacterium]